MQTRPDICADWLRLSPGAERLACDTGEHGRSRLAAASRLMLQGLLGMSLAGCIAALPLAAGGAILRGQTDGRSGAPAAGRGADTSGLAPASQGGGASDTSGLAAASGAGAAADTSGPGSVQPADGGRLAGLAPRPPAARGALVPEGVSALPLPDHAAPGEAAALAALRTRAERRLADEQPGPSALLARPSGLGPERVPCRTGPSAMLVDLDPAGGLAPLETTGQPRALAATLAALRRQGLVIAWITDRAPRDARAIRAALAAAGLDPEGTDPLLVQRYPGEAKQARRRALGAGHCVLAIAGDSREDFDDLFAYLLEPGAAWRLEPLIGEAWFLIETPL